MQRVFLLFGALIFVLAPLAPAAASEFAWKGSLRIPIGGLPPVVGTGTGLATLNSSAGGSHLTTLRLGPGFQLQATVVVTDPEVTAAGILSIKASGTPSAGTLGPFSNGGGPLTQNQLPAPGMARLCLFFSGCTSAFIPIEFTANSGMTGLGVGGTITAGGAGTIRVSLQYNPWTIGTAVVPSVPTVNGGFTSETTMGFVHGPASASSSSGALTSAVVQVVTPVVVDTQGVPGNNSRLALFGVYTIHLIPEPGVLLLLGSGVVGLLALGRKRLR